MTANLSASSPHDYPRLDATPETSAAMIREHAPKTAAVIGAEALREAADKWTRGGWSDVMLPKPTPPAVPVIAYSNRMGDWLRALARTLDTDGGER